MSKKIDKFVNVSETIEPVVEKSDDMEVDESGNKSDHAVKPDVDMTNADDTSADAEMKDPDPSPAGLEEAVVDHLIDTFGTAIAEDIAHDRDQQMADAMADASAEASIAEDAEILKVHMK